MEQLRTLTSYLHTLALKKAMTNSSTCLACGAPLAQGNRSGMCPACLLQAAMRGNSTRHQAPGEAGAARPPFETKQPAR